MKRLHTLLVALLLIGYHTSLVAAPYNESPDDVTTQLSMSDESCQDYQMQDQEMNDLYKSLKRSYNKDRRFLKRLKKAQKRWLKFRDAHLDSMYPKVKNDARTASNKTMCRCILLTSMTKTRNDQLRDMQMAEEGDVCALPPPAMPADEHP